MKERYHVTGNMAVSLPTIRERDAAIESISFLHMGAKGMIELCGGEEPLLRPFVCLQGKELPLQDVRWNLLHGWIPRLLPRWAPAAWRGRFWRRWRSVALAFPCVFWGRERRI